MSRPMTGYDACLKVVMHDAANRLAYLGYYGDELVDFLIFILSKEGFYAYKDVVASSRASGYDPIVDRKPWAGRGLPDPSRLSGLPHALDFLAIEYADYTGSDPFAPLACITQGK